MASVFTAISMLPQLLRVIRVRNADGLSPLTISSLFVGVGLWTVYGIQKEDLIIAISNGFSLLITATLGILFIIFRNKPKRTEVQNA